MDNVEKNNFFMKENSFDYNFQEKRYNLGLEKFKKWELDLKKYLDEYLNLRYNQLPFERDLVDFLYQLNNIQIIMSNLNEKISNKFSRLVTLINKLVKIQDENYTTFDVDPKYKMLYQPEKVSTLVKPCIKEINSILEVEI